MPISATKFPSDRISCDTGLYNITVEILRALTIKLTQVRARARARLRARAMVSSRARARAWECVYV